jgi:hypothetical protein
VLALRTQGDLRAGRRLHLEAALGRCHRHRDAVPANAAHFKNSRYQGTCKRKAQS